MGWNVDFEKINKRRQNRFLKIRGNDKLIRGAFNYYRTRPIEFINDWGVTYDPRNAFLKPKTMTLMPFCLFKRQRELVQFFYECLIDQEHGAIEKCREVGASWVAVNFAVWCWIFYPGSAVGFGSRKAELVDNKNDPKSIFDKIRVVIRNLPSFFRPEGFKEDHHATYMKVINPINAATMVGESGEKIGRGGRTTFYVKDESAHYEQAESIEAALSENTNVQIDISSVNGPHTLFQNKINTGVIWEPGKKIPSGEMRVFIFDWSDHPMKTQEWYDKKRAKFEREGLLHVFAQEIERDNAALLDGILIPQKWIKVAVDAHKKLGIAVEGSTMAAFDVADSGPDKNSISIRKGILLNKCIDWMDEDAGKATRKAIFICNSYHIKSFQYDSIGIGTGAKVETNRLSEANVLNKDFKILAWNAAKGPLLPNARVIPGDKQSPKNKDFYSNLKAQAGWQLRLRFEKTYRYITEDIKYPIDELISINSKIDDLQGLLKELSQPTYSTNLVGKIVINKKPDGAKSPNRFDSTSMVYWPVKKRKVLI